MKNILLIGFLLLNLFANAQLNPSVANTEVFRGVLYDLQTGEHLEGASVSIECDNKLISTLTDDQGYFILVDAPKSCLSIKISMSGYEDRVLENITRVKDVEYYIGLDPKKVMQPKQLN